MFGKVDLLALHYPSQIAFECGVFQAVFSDNHALDFSVVK